MTKNNFIVIIYMDIKEIKILMFYYYYYYTFYVRIEKIIIIYFFLCIKNKIYIKN